MLPSILTESPLLGTLLALGVFGAVLLLAAMVNIGLGIAARSRQSRNPGGIDAQILLTLRGASFLFLITLGIFLGFFVLTKVTAPGFSIFNNWGDDATHVWLVVIIALGSYLFYRLINILLTAYIKILAIRQGTDLDVKLLPPARRFLTLIIYSIGALIALQSLGISIGPFLAGIGIGGLAIALALQPALTNYFAGTYIVTEGAIKEGDYIELPDGAAGVVVEVGWRSTHMLTRFNNLVVIPNAQLAESTVTNYSIPTPAVTTRVKCGVSYDSNLSHVKRVGLEVAQAVLTQSEYAVREFEPALRFIEFGDSNIDFFLIVQAKDRLGSYILTSELVEQLHDRFNQEGIEINYPVRKLIHPPSIGQLPSAETFE